MSDTVGVGSEDFDDRLGMFVPKDVRARAVNSVADMLRKPGFMRASSRPSSSSSSSVSRHPSPSLKPELGDAGDARHNQTDAGWAAEEKPILAHEAKHEMAEEDNTRRTQERKIFDGLVIYINGSTHPLVSDIKLKRLVSEHGARMSLHLGRRQVTHVILGKPSGPNGGAGGGLAGGKLEREIRRVGGCGIKFVGVEWYVCNDTLTLFSPASLSPFRDAVCLGSHGYCAELVGGLTMVRSTRVLESIKAGKRLPEARFANLKIAARRQQSVLGAFSKADGSTQQPAAHTPGS
jgi:hypothetical protein